MDFWVDTTMEGYIIEFTAENHLSFSQEKVIFKKGVQKILIREIPLWIKVFLVEEGMLIVPSIEMVA
jgi:hypothetical protein